MTSIRKLGNIRFWVLFVLLGAAAACGSSENNSCEPGDDNYPQCLED